jgi:hypothetical protein
VWRYIVAKLSNKSMVDNEPTIDDYDVPTNIRREKSERQLMHEKKIFGGRLYEDNPSDIERDYE